MAAAGVSEPTKMRRSEWRKLGLSTVPALDAALFSMSFIGGKGAVRESRSLWRPRRRPPTSFAGTAAVLASLKESGVKLSGYAKRFLTEPEGWLEGLHEGTYEEGYRQYLYDFQSWPPVDKLRGKGVLQRLKTFFPKCRVSSFKMKGSCAYLLQQTYGAMLGALGTDDGAGFDWSAGAGRNLG